MRVGRVAALSDTGRRRLGNEDAYVCDPPLFAVTDGMGGAQAGELASRLAAAALEERERGLQGEEAVTALVQTANERVYRRALEDPAAAGMGTTATVALVDGDAGRIALGHVGDSRAYRIRGERLEQLTEDHSLVGELLRSGRLTPEEAAEHPHRAVITRVLGTEERVEVDTFSVGAEPGDLYLICSDGLTAMVGDEQIGSIVAAFGREPGAIVRALVDAANQAGGDDNITVVVFEIVEGEPPADTAVSREPLEETAEHIDVPVSHPLQVNAAAAAEDSVNRRGAGKGGRVLALAAIVVGLAAATLILWWGFVR